MFHDDLSALLNYPAGPLKAPLAEDPETSRLMGEFVKRIVSLAVTDREELYTRTFDINPICSLEVGWQLYGENYDRGRFLVTMRQQLRRFGLPESTELPDHLTQAVRVWARMELDEAAQFASEFLLPAIGKMLAGFKDKENPYRFLLEAIRSEVCKRTGIPVDGIRPEMNLFPILQGVEQ
jgi:nitrate reductase delta subunit